MRFPLRLLLAVLIASPAAILHAQAEPAQEEPAPDPGTQRQQQPTAGSQAVSDSQPAADDRDDAATEAGQDRGEAATEAGQDRGQASESGATQADDRDAADAHETRAANVDTLSQEIRHHPLPFLPFRQAGRDNNDYPSVSEDEFRAYEGRLYEIAHPNGDDTYLGMSMCSMDILRRIRQRREGSRAQDDFQHCLLWLPSIEPATAAYLWENFSDLLGRIN